MESKKEDKNKYLFSWDEIPGDDDARLIEFLNRHFAIELEINAEFNKKDDDTINVSTGENFVSLSLNDEKTKVYLKIDEVRKYEFIAKKEKSNINIYKNKIVFILIKVKPKYLIEFNIMMVACQELCQRNKPQEDELADILSFFPIFGPFDFYLKISGENKKIIRTILIIREKFSIYINETCTLTSFEMSEILSNDDKELLKIIYENKYELDDWDNANVIDKDGKIKYQELPQYQDKEAFIDSETFRRLVKFKQELGDSTNNGKELYNQRFVFIRVKPVFTKKFILAINLIRNFCEYSTSQEFAKINDIYYIVGPFDYLLEINRNNENKISKTIFKIRETLGDYIFDTVTIKKIYLPITNDEIKKLFKNRFGEEYILNKDGEKIPNENNQLKLEFNLDEISQAETSSLRNLLNNIPKFLSEYELNKRIDEMENHIEKLEKNIRNKE